MQKGVIEGEYNKPLPLPSLQQPLNSRTQTPIRPLNNRVPTPLYILPRRPPPPLLILLPPPRLGPLHRPARARRVSSCAGAEGGGGGEIIVGEVFDVLAVRVCHGCGGGGGGMRRQMEACGEWFELVCGLRLGCGGGGGLLEVRVGCDGFEV